MIELLSPRSQASQRGEFRRVVFDQDFASDGPRYAKYQARFPGNRISTAKYNVFTFLPKFLFMMFCKAAYFYFLVQTCLSWWEVVSPFGGVGFTMALLFVLGVAAVKEGIEDRKRHRYDRVTNTSGAHVVNPAGEVEDVQWQDVKVGQIILVEDGEEIPADCVCLHTALPNCYVHTANLDGETNLKVKSSLRGVELSAEEVTIHEMDPTDVLRATMDSATERMNTVKDRGRMREEAFKLSKVVGELHCELPSADLHTFRGYAVIKSNPWLDNPEGRPSFGSASEQGQDEMTKEPEKIPVDMSAMLLRGTMLKNSGYAFGLVIYTGKETRILMNSGQRPNKTGTFDTFLNIQICILAVIQLLLCVGCALGSYFWRENTGYQMYYLMMNSYDTGNFESTGAYILVYTLSFWILYSSMVPISLFVTLEMVRFWQCIAFIDHDPEMRVSEDATLWPKARSSNVNEDLGKISYVFSDKTGTLTSNDMQLRLIASRGMKMGNESYKFEDVAPGTPAMKVAGGFDQTLREHFRILQRFDLLIDHMHLGKPEALKEYSAEEENACRTLNLFVTMALCHSVLPEQDVGSVSDSDSGGKLGQDITYQGPSPDEVCIVGAAQKLGFSFLEHKHGIMYADMLGKKLKFRVLNVLEFSSERRRMSIIVQDQRKRTYLMCKGADSAILPRLAASESASGIDIEGMLHEYACKGLRTLIFAAKRLTFEEWKEFNTEYHEAANDIAKREERMADCMDRIEQGMHFLGVTAVEDKLQEEVPESIQTLRKAGIKVWVITGDKQETAINIGVACKLVTDADQLVRLNEGDKSELRQLIPRLLNEISLNRRKNANAKVKRPQEIVVDGQTLGLILAEEELRTGFAMLGSLCDAVLVCRASPAQKAAIVDLMKLHEKRKLTNSKPWGFKWVGWLQNLTENKMLSIGDGANDVPMIQRADVGVGIVGKEGRQASNNSDFSIARFRFLVRLLLVHGQLTQYRNANLIKYSFYKNICISFVFFYFQFYSGYSAQALMDSLTLNFYNTTFTAIPILIFALLDRQVNDVDTLLDHPQTYNTSTCLTTLIFWKAQVKALFDAAICFFIPYYAAFSSGNETLDGVMAVGRVTYLAVQGVVTLEIMAISRHYTSMFVAFVVYSFFIVFPFFYLFQATMQGINLPDPAQAGVTTLTFGSLSVWLQLIVVYCISIGLRIIEKGFKQTFYPDDIMILSESELAKRRGKCVYDGQNGVADASAKVAELRRKLDARK